MAGDWDYRKLLDSYPAFHFDSIEQPNALDAYQQNALSTAGRSKDGDWQLAVCGLGIAGEAGEVADYIKKVVGHGHALDSDKMVKELGDVLWYVAMTAAAIGVPLSVVADVNAEKLRARYPNGFERARSIDRQPSDT